MTLRVSSLTGFGGGGSPPIEIVGSVTGNKSTTALTTHPLGNINVGSASSDKNILLAITYTDSTSKTISDLTVGGVSLTQKAFIEIDSGDALGCAIYAGDISSINGSKAISVTFSGPTDGAAVSGVAITGLRSLTPTMSDTDSNSSGSQLIISNLSAAGGGIVFACGCGNDETGASTWGSVTERADVSVAAARGHRHTAAWDVGIHSANNETLDITGSVLRAAAGAGFR